MKNRWLITGTGFALFSMFFGSGNLVFPITVGQASEGRFLLAALGILLTGVLVPFLGVFAMMLYKGEIYDFFSSFGKTGTLIFSFLSLALMGPFGVLARCLTVAHGALLLLIPSASLPITSFIFCLVIFAFVINRNQIVSTLGMILTPFLLLSIALITGFGLLSTSFPEKGNLSSFLAFKTGFFQGYQTMDLLAAFFFSQFIIRHLRNQKNEKDTESSLLKHFCKSALLGGGLLSLIYFSLVLLGWIYSPFLGYVPPEEMLGVIAMHSLGPWAAPCVCIAVMFACLTTAIVLTSLFADFLRTEVCKRSIKNIPAIMITLVIGFFVSTFNFAGIAKFIGPILVMIYPALIIFTLFNIYNYFFSNKTTSHWPFSLTLLVSLLWTVKGINFNEVIKAVTLHINSLFLLIM